MCPVELDNPRILPAALFLGFMWPACNHPKRGSTDRDNSEQCCSSTTGMDDTGDEGFSLDVPGPYRDLDIDGDGSKNSRDCDDTNPNRFPGAPETCGDGEINNCDGAEQDAWQDCSVVTADSARAELHVGTSDVDELRVVSAGDLDGDGYSDLAISRNTLFIPSDDGSEGWYAGGVFVFSPPRDGTISSSDADSLVVGATEVPARDHLGWDLKEVGDIDGDGFDDLIAGAVDGRYDPYLEPTPGFSPSDTPTVYLLHGPLTVGSALDNTVLIGPAQSAEQCYGSMLASFPDIDGDGQDDFLTSCSVVGRLGIYSTSTEWQTPEEDALSEFEGEPIPGGGGRFGHSAGSLDANADGIADIAIGAPSVRTVDGEESVATGTVYLFEGPFDDQHYWDSADVELRPSSSDVLEVYGGRSLRFGSAVAIADWNNDGLDDLSVGIPYYSTDGTQFNGAVAIFLGPYDDSGGLSDADVLIYGDATTALIGGDLDTQADLNLDGSTDLVIGNGFIEVFGGESYQSASRSFLNAHAFFGPFESGHFVASDADIRFDFTGEDTFLGAQVETLTDSNGDGWPEVLVSDGSTLTYLFDMPTW